VYCVDRHTDDTPCDKLDRIVFHQPPRAPPERQLGLQAAALDLVSDNRVSLLVSKRTGIPVLWAS
jgi:hypothetical protein